MGFPFWACLRRLFPAGEICIMHEFHRPPYGGGNQFLLGVADELAKLGIGISKGAIGSDTHAILLNSFNFDFQAIRNLPKSGLRLVHRVDGPISIYRGNPDPAIDISIAKINADVADATIFQSRYSLEKHLEMGLNFRAPLIIHNAASKKYFFPPPKPRQPGSRLKIIGSAWSDNPKKGLSVYEWLDQHADHSQFEFTFVGRTKGSFQNVRTIEALPSAELGALLRTQDLYLAPSVDDPCSNALVEALACGLPAIFRRSGGHPELVGKGGLGFDSVEEIPSLLDKAIYAMPQLRAAVRAPDLDEVTRSYLASLLPEKIKLMDHLK